LTTFQTFGSHNFLFQYGTATKFSKFVDNLFGFITLLTESKCYFSILRYVSSNGMVYFSPHALFSQARSHIVARRDTFHVLICLYRCTMGQAYVNTKLTGIMNFLLISGCGTCENNIRGHSFIWSGACEFTKYYNCCKKSKQTSVRDATFYCYDPYWL